MKLSNVFNPWAACARLTLELADAQDRLARSRELLQMKDSQIQYLEGQLAQFSPIDKQKPGGSRPRIVK